MFVFIVFYTVDKCYALILTHCLSGYSVVSSICLHFSVQRPQTVTRQCVAQHLNSQVLEGYMQSVWKLLICFLNGGIEATQWEELLSACVSAYQLGLIPVARDRAKNKSALHACGQRHDSNVIKPGFRNHQRHVNTLMLHHQPIEKEASCFLTTGTVELWNLKATWDILLDVGTARTSLI